MPSLLEEAVGTRHEADEFAPATKVFSKEDELNGHKRWLGIDDLGLLLAHDVGLGGVPMRLLRARWVLEFFNSKGDAVLQPRQCLERDHPDAFASDAMIQSILGEVAGANRVHPVLSSDLMRFPGLVGFSYCWLSREHPDPYGRTLRTGPRLSPAPSGLGLCLRAAPAVRPTGRQQVPSQQALVRSSPVVSRTGEIWLPALEWYLSERVRARWTKRQLATTPRAAAAPVRHAMVGQQTATDGLRAEHERGNMEWEPGDERLMGMSDEELLADADFGIFIECALAPRPVPPCSLPRLPRVSPAACHLPRVPRAIPSPRILEPR